MVKQISGLLKTYVCGVMMLAGVVSCEKMNVDGSDDDGSKANVVLRIGSVEQVPFEMAKTRGRDVNGVCSRLNFLVYQDGERIRQISQTSDEEGFGEARIQLAEGQYFLVVLAHSSNGNPTSTNANKIGFTNTTGFTDTFFYAADLIVEDEDVTRTLELKRITAMVRFIPYDNIPVNAGRIRFYYTGGSGTLDAGSDGWGVVNSKQSQWYDLTHNEEKFEIYTIPHGADDELTVTASTYKGQTDNIETERKIEGIPVLRNHITICRGYLFAPVYQMDYEITIDDRWSTDSLYFDF
jgi:hypothetical protein